jgi:hypothetical protein
MNIDSIVLQRSDEIAWSALDDEIVVLDMEEGAYFTLNEVSAEIWKLIDGKRTISEIINAVHEVYEADYEMVKEDAIRIISDFSRKYLIELSYRVEEKKKPVKGGVKKPARKKVKHP